MCLPTELACLSTGLARCGGRGPRARHTLGFLLCALSVKGLHPLTSVDCEQDEFFHLNKFLLLTWRTEWQHDSYLCAWAEFCFLWCISAPAPTPPAHLADTVR